jgi:hypothetical protein
MIMSALNLFCEDSELTIKNITEDEKILFSTGVSTNSNP